MGDAVGVAIGFTLALLVYFWVATRVGLFDEEHWFEPAARFGGTLAMGLAVLAWIFVIWRALNPSP